MVATFLLELPSQTVERCLTLGVSLLQERDTPAEREREPRMRRRRNNGYEVVATSAF